MHRLASPFGQCGEILAECDELPLKKLRENQTKSRKNSFFLNQGGEYAIFSQNILYLYIYIRRCVHQYSYVRARTLCLSTRKNGLNDGQYVLYLLDLAKTLVLTHCEILLDDTLHQIDLIKTTTLVTHFSIADPGPAPEGAPVHQSVQQDPRQEPGHRAAEAPDEVPARGQEGEAAAAQGDRRREGGRKGPRPFQGAQGGKPPF